MSRGVLRLSLLITTCTAAAAAEQSRACSTIRCQDTTKTSQDRQGCAACSRCLVWLECSLQSPAQSDLIHHQRMPSDQSLGPHPTPALTEISCLLSIPPPPAPRRARAHAPSLLTLRAKPDSNTHRDLAPHEYCPIQVVECLLSITGVLVLKEPKATGPAGVDRGGGGWAGVNKAASQQ